MVNKRNKRKKSLRAISKTNRTNALQRNAKRKAAAGASGLKTPKSLVILCERVIKKHKLYPAAQKEFTPPETFSVVGGKPLRKRSETKKYVASTSTPKNLRKKLPFDPKRLVDLCQDVIEEYNLLPETEETLQPKSTRKRSRSQSNISEKRPRGRPSKKSKATKDPNVALHCEVKRGRGRPPKDPLAALYTVKYTYPENSQPQLSHVRIKEEVDLPLDAEEEEEFTVEIKEEPDSGDEASFEVPITAPPTTVIPPIVVKSQGFRRINKTQSPNVPAPGPSRRRDQPTINLMTVVLDEYQIFANSIADQLRALPPNRALMLQLDIQSIIDNEKQLINDEN